MQSKLHINASQGIIDVEGDADLIREVYNDFKDKLIEQFAAAPGGIAQEEPVAKPKNSKRKNKNPAKKASKASPADANGVDANKPKLDKDLNTSGLAAFYDFESCKNNCEKILVSLKFLTDELSIAHPNTDQVFTCFKDAKQKIPTAFAQAFRDTSNVHGFINYISPTEIEITTKGDNHFEFEMEKAAE